MNSKKIKLGNILKEVNNRTTSDGMYEVLTSSQAGLVSQEDYFKKTVASKDTTGYKIIKNGQYTYRAMSDTGRFYINRLDNKDVGIVSPAYPVFEYVDNEDVLNNYLLEYFSSEKFQSDVSLLHTGSTRASLKFKQIQELYINVPSICEQKLRIRCIELINHLILTLSDIEQKYDATVKSRFIEMFGDPLKSEACEPLSKVAILERGRFSPRPRNDPQYYDGDYPFVQTGDIANCDHRLSHYEQTLNEKGIKVSKCFKAGTILIAIVGATIGATAILQRDMYAPDSVIGITVSEQYEPVFMEMLLRFWKDELMRIAPDAARANINLEILGKVQIMKVSIEKQKDFVVFMEQVDKSKLAVQEMKNKMEVLKASVMQEYFC